MSDQFRRRILQATTTAMIGGLAGCSTVDRLMGSSDDDDPDPDPNEEENEQQFTIPPIAYFDSSGVPEDGQVPISITFKPATTPGEVNVYFEDELTFELFYYTQFPVGNSLDLTKVAEVSRTPYEKGGVTISVPFEDLPKNQQMRFRLRITNENTGDTEWAFDQQIFHYETFGDSILSLGGDRVGFIEGNINDLNQTTFERQGDNYVITFTGGRDFPASELIEEIPYSWEAFKEENDLWNEQGGEAPVGKPRTGRLIEFSQSHVEMANEIMDRFSAQENYNTFAGRYGVLQDYDYYGNTYYEVLNNPVYEEMADTINEAHNLYGVNQHYAKLQQVMTQVQANPYDQITGSVRNAPIKLPEAYLADPSENCVGHTFNLCWYLYSLGYTCGAAYLELGGRRADHMGVALPVPESVMEEQFPEDYPEAFHVEGNTAQYIENTSDIANPEGVPDSLGEYPWIYMETTGPASVGSIPFDDVQDARIRYAIEPENNAFGTDIGVTNGE